MRACVLKFYVVQQHSAQTMATKQKLKRQKTFCSDGAGAVDDGAGSPSTGPGDDGAGSHGAGGSEVENHRDGGGGGSEDDMVGALSTALLGEGTHDDDGDFEPEHLGYNLEDSSHTSDYMNDKIIDLCEDPESERVFSPTLSNAYSPTESELAYKPPQSEPSCATSYALFKERAIDNAQKEIENMIVVANSWLIKLVQQGSRGQVPDDVEAWLLRAGTFLSSMAGTKDDPEMTDWGQKIEDVTKDVGELRMRFFHLRETLAQSELD